MRGVSLFLVQLLRRVQAAGATKRLLARGVAPPKPTLPPLTITDSTGDNTGPCWAGRRRQLRQLSDKTPSWLTRPCPLDTGQNAGEILEELEINNLVCFIKMNHVFVYMNYARFNAHCKNAKRTIQMLSKSANKIQNARYNDALLEIKRRT